MKKLLAVITFILSIITISIGKPLVAKADAITPLVDGAVYSIRMGFDEEMCLLVQNGTYTESTNIILGQWYGDNNQKFVVRQVSALEDGTYTYRIHPFGHQEMVLSFNYNNSTLHLELIEYGDLERLHFDRFSIGLYSGNNYRIKTGYTDYDKYLTTSVYTPMAGITLTSKSLVNSKASYYNFKFVRTNDLLPYQTTQVYLEAAEEKVFYFYSQYDWTMMFETKSAGTMYDTIIRIYTEDGSQIIMSGDNKDYTTLFSYVNIDMESMTMYRITVAGKSFTDIGNVYLEVKPEVTSSIYGLQLEDLNGADFMLEIESTTAAFDNAHSMLFENRSRSYMNQLLNDGYDRFNRDYFIYIGDTYDSTGRQLYLYNDQTFDSYLSFDNMPSFSNTDVAFWFASYSAEYNATSTNVAKSAHENGAAVSIGYYRDISFTYVGEVYLTYFMAKATPGTIDPVDYLRIATLDIATRYQAFIQITKDGIDEPVIYYNNGQKEHFDFLQSNDPNKSANENVLYTTETDEYLILDSLDSKDGERKFYKYNGVVTNVKDKSLLSQYKPISSTKVPYRVSAKKSHDVIVKDGEIFRDLQIYLDNTNIYRIVDINTGEYFTPKEFEEFFR